MNRWLMTVAGVGTLSMATLFASAQNNGGGRRGPQERGPAGRQIQERGPQDRGPRGGNQDAAPGDDRIPPPPDGPDGPHPPLPPLPVLRVIDVDGNGELSAEEIAKASAALKKLDKDGDGKLSRRELLPPPSREGQGPPDEQGGNQRRLGEGNQDGPRGPRGEVGNGQGEPGSRGGSGGPGGPGGPEEPRGQRGGRGR